MISGIKCKPFKVVVVPAETKNGGVEGVKEVIPPANRNENAERGNRFLADVYNAGNEEGFAVQEESLYEGKFRRGNGRSMKEVKYVGSYVVCSNNYDNAGNKTDYYSAGRIVEGKLKDFYSTDKTSVTGALVNLKF